MLKVFIGYDPRQPIAYHVLCSSIIRNCSVPVQITPLIIGTLPIKREGLTQFTFSRYLAPYLCNYHGISVFIDSDMLVLGDMSELLNYADDAVSIVPFENDLMFERPSVMVFNNGKCKSLTPNFIDDETSAPQSLSWADSIGYLPDEWNHLVGYAPNIPEKNIKLLHFTQGIPAYKECRFGEYAELWFKELKIMQDHVSWLEIMGNSVHARHVLNRLKNAN